MLVEIQLRNKHFSVLIYGFIIHNQHNNAANNLQFIYEKLHDVLTALHNQENNDLPEFKKEDYRIKLHTFGLDISDSENKTMLENDRTIMDIIFNSTQPGIKIYGYVNPGKVAGYRVEIGISGNIQGHMSEEEKLNFLDRYFPEAPIIRKLIGKEK